MRYETGNIPEGFVKRKKELQNVVMNYIHITVFFQQLIVNLIKLDKK